MINYLENERILAAQLPVRIANGVATTQRCDAATIYLSSDVTQVAF